MPNPKGAVAGNAQNLPEAHVPRTRSTFPLHAHRFNTHRFGEYIPFYVDDLTKDDRYPIHSSSQVRTYTLKTPLMQNLTRNKDYFMVPMESILPWNWEKFFDNPVRGDDVAVDVGPTVEDFWKKVYTMMTSMSTSLFNILDASSSNTDIESILSSLRFCILGEYFYSDGNLISSLGCHGSSYVYCSNSNGDRVTWDDFFDACVTTIVSKASGNHLFNLSVDGVTYYVVIDPDKTGSYNISIRHALQLMRDNPTFTISNLGTGLSGIKADLYSWLDDNSNTFITATVPFNLSRLWAYQLCVSHYMTNDHIDYVYSAELYRQLIGHYIVNNSQSSFSALNATFLRNGIRYRYDYLSAHFCTSFFAQGAAQPTAILTGTNPTGNSAVQYAFYLLGYFSALFGYRRSLRYLDYFTGSRAMPLAVVNYGSLSTNGSGLVSPSLSVFDITRSIQAQRFLNSVNRVRHSFEGYLKGIFGGKMPAPDYHNPFYLAHCSDSIFGQETENTGAAQLSFDSNTGDLSGAPIAVTTNLRGSGKYMFECDSDRPCIVIGISSFDIPRVYQHSTERSFFHTDRFDWFNPFWQYIGDQPVYLQELGISPTTSALSTMQTFAYQLRHMEFKQKFNTAAGGFCVPSTNLDNWIFGAMDVRGNQLTISPDWIRSVSAEFDRYYVSLTGYSLGTYFHFIVDDFNSVNASRPMAYSPQILG